MLYLFLEACVLYCDPFLVDMGILNTVYPVNSVYACCYTPNWLLAGLSLYSFWQQQVALRAVYYPDSSGCALCYTIDETQVCTWDLDLFCQR